jgi:hypothetical protein
MMDGAVSAAGLELEEAEVAVAMTHHGCRRGAPHPGCAHPLLPLMNPGPYQRGPGSGPGLRRSVRTPGRWSGSSTDRPAPVVG